MDLSNCDDHVILRKSWDGLHEADIDNVCDS
jgi:hypothetical protein